MSPLSTIAGTRYLVFQVRPVSFAEDLPIISLYGPAVNCQAVHDPRTAEVGRNPVGSLFVSASDLVERWFEHNTLQVPGISVPGFQARK